MNLIEKATVMHYHRHRIAEHRAGDVKALGWRGEHSQQARYAVLAQVGDIEGRSVLDAGCGHGDLKAYLDRHASHFEYIGIDQMPEFIEEAHRRYRHHPATAFYQSDFATAELPKVDYVFASGAMGYRCANPHFHFELIARLYAAAHRALAFNMLDAEHFPEHPLLVGRDKVTVLAFCRMLAPRVELVDGYLEDDFTIFMYRDR